MKMRFANLLTICLLATVSACLLNPAHASDNDQTATLVLDNNDSIPGKVVSVDSGLLDWQCDLFESPLKIRLDSIHEIKLPVATSPGRSQDDYQIRTVSGDLLFAQILKVEDGVVFLKSERHGSIELKVAQIAKIRNSKKSQTLVSSFADSESWDSLKNQKENWLFEGAVAYTQTESANIYRHFETLPDIVDISLRCQFSALPDFSLGLQVPRSTEFEDEILRIETWDGSLVLVHADGDFEILMETIPDDQRQLELAVAWNRENNEMVIRSQGKILADVTVRPATENSKTGFYLRNREGDFRVTGFGVTSGIGGDAKPEVGSLTKTDGESLQLDDEFEFNGNTWAFGEEKLPAESLYQIWLAEPDTAPHSLAQAKLRYLDGGQVSGKLVSVGDQSFSVETAFSDSPVECAWRDLAAVDFAKSNSPQDETDASESAHQLTCPFGTIHGRLGFAADGESLPEWTPFGSETAVKLAYQMPFTVNLGKKASKDDKRPATLVDTLHLTNGDLIACRVESIDTEHAQVLSPFGKRSVPLTHIKAVDFGQKQPREDLAFDRSQGWKLKMQSGKDSDCIGVKNVRIGRSDKLVHPNFRGDQLRFSLRRNGKDFENLQLDYRFEVRLFNSDSEADDGIGILIRALGQNTFEIRGLDRRRGMYGMPGNSPNRIKSKSNSVEVLIQLVDSKLLAWLNGEMAFSMKVNRDTRILGSVLTFRNLSQETIGGLNGANGRDWFDVSNVQSEFLFGQTARSVIVNQKRLDQLLTVPRAQRNYPPRNIVASNKGDFLRGKLTALTGKTLAFESGSRDFSFDRDRISNIVWLHDVKDPEDDGEEAADTTFGSEELQFLLGNGQRISLKPTRFGDGELEGESNSIGSGAIEFALAQEVRFLGTTVAEPNLESQRNEVGYRSWVACFAEPPHRMKAPDAGGAGKVSPLVGKPAIDFETVYAADGEAFRLSDLKGKVVILDFWATWCGPCVSSMPKLISDIESLDTDDVVLIAVNQGESAEKVNNFIDARNWNLNSVLDTDSAIGEQYQVEGIPMSVIITPEGIVSAVNTGPAHDIKADIERARKGELAAAPAAVEVGADAPEIESLYAHNQRQFRLSELKGKVVVLDFWATWSDECTSRTPKIISQVESFGPDEVVLVGINEGENATTINDFIEEKNWSLRSIQDPKMSIGQSYRVDSLPRTIVIDRAGKTVAIDSESEVDLKSAIEKALSATSAAPSEDQAN